MSRALFLILIGLGGAAILVWLGVWQLNRLSWKETMIADIEMRIAADPSPLSDNVDPEADAYAPVEVTGALGTPDIRVLVSQKDAGAGYRLITPLTTSQGRIMVDRGFVQTDVVPPPVPQGQVTIIGNLQWPQETDSFTPAPDRDRDIWFARDVPAMAQALGTQEILVVARAVSYDSGPVHPLPVATARIPNDHLQYAITWFSLAAIWLAMTFYFLRRRTKSES